ncbi:hypothetical protein TNIN_81101 [Trichonephila inaurata madagascariensis]|uniref:Solute carrier family 13 member 5 n=1 Tax=Trichonephila inaurata madagascariensis TaxID=2747483 RepID=A0A8X6X7S3_9ARAC|nr:hypothetical protein TNIN_81101 [Trichonephila inaurata madagascariensis]
MYLGGLAVAVAVEHCNLHERLALKVLLLLGTDTKWLMLGFMLTTMFLSMWISNTATTAMLVPIVEAVMLELRSGMENLHSDSGPLLNLEALHTTLLLSIAYSANCGGTGTVTGTSPNMILKGFMEEHYPESSELTFASWMAYNVPGMLICVCVGWITLQVLYVPCWRKQNEESKKRIRRVIASRYEELGTITYGYSKTFDAKVKESLIALQSRRVKGRRGIESIFRSVKSGLSKWLGAQMVELSVLSPFMVQIILCVCTATLTEIMSNSTVATILLPVVNEMAIAFHVHPLYLMLPVTVVSSYAFMLPVATGPNAIAFDSGRMKTIEMVKPGIVMNILCCFVQLAMVNTLGTSLFDLNTFPSWVNTSSGEGNWTRTFNSSKAIT